MSLLQKLLLVAFIIVGILFFINLYLSYYQPSGNFDKMTQNLEQRMPNNKDLYNKLKEAKINDTLTGTISQLKKKITGMVAFIDKINAKVDEFSDKNGSQSTKGSTWMINKQKTRELYERFQTLNQLGETLTTPSYNSLTPEKVLKLETKGITWDKHFEELPHTALKALLSFLKLKVKEEEEYILEYALENRTNRITTI